MVLEIFLDGKMRYLFFLLILLSPELYGQKPNDLHKAGQYVFLLKGGFDLHYRGDLEEWLSKYGVKTNSNIVVNFGIKALLPASRTLLIGGEFNWMISNQPYKNDLSFDLELGKCFKIKTIQIIPLMGIGIVNSLIRFDNSVPAPLAQLNASGGQLSQNALLIKPNVLLIKKFYHFTFVIELGCRVYSFSNDWKYYENGTNGSFIKVPQVPYNGYFHPYASIVLGLNVGY